MTKSETSNFLRLLNESNARIAAAEAEKEAQAELETDQVRLQRDAERREKYGTLRARPHPTRQQKKGVSQLFG